MDRVTRRIAQALALGSCIFAVVGCSAGEDSQETTGTETEALSECGPAPHFMAVGGACLPSCGAAGGNYCSGNGNLTPPIFSNMGPTWDCAYCYRY